jgi:hypothetical protein
MVNTADAELMIELFIFSCHDVIFLLGISYLPLLLVHLESVIVLFMLYIALSK